MKGLVAESSMASRSINQRLWWKKVSTQRPQRKSLDIILCEATAHLNWTTTFFHLFSAVATLGGYNSVRAARGETFNGCCCMLRSFFPTLLAFFVCGSSCIMPKMNVTWLLQAHFRKAVA